MSTTPVTPTASRNCRAWVTPVLSRGGVEDEEHLGDPARGPVGDPADLLQLLHQVHLGVEPSGGVGQHQRPGPGPTPSGRRRRRRRSGRCLRRPARAPTPDRSAQIASCSAAAARKVSPAARSSDRPSADCRRAILPMVVVFPTPFTPTKSQTLVTPSSSARPTPPAPSSDARSACAQGGDHGVGSPQLARADALAKIVEQRRGGGHPDVGPQQGLFEIVPGLIVDGSPAPQGPDVPRQADPGSCPSGRADRPGPMTSAPARIGPSPGRRLDRVGGGRPPGWRPGGPGPAAAAPAPERPGPAVEPRWSEPVVTPVAGAVRRRRGERRASPAPARGRTPRRARPSDGQRPPGRRRRPGRSRGRAWRGQPTR